MDALVLLPNFSTLVLQRQFAIIDLGLAFLGQIINLYLNQSNCVYIYIPNQ